MVFLSVQPLQWLVLTSLFLGTDASFLDFGIPFSNATVSVKAFDVVSPGNVTGLASDFFQPVLPGTEPFHIPVYAFLIEHRKSGKRVMFDLGIRSDPENLAPATFSLISSGAIQLPPAFKGITERLVDGGIPLQSIDAVIWSHSHFDHIGDMSKFPNTTSLVIGEGTDRAVYPEDANATLLESDFAGHNVIEVSFNSSKLSFGGFPAIDYFGDGSLYLLDSPGHLPGHMSAIARVTTESFIVLGGDFFHHVGQLRPTAHLQHHFPCPAELIAETAKTVSTDFFWSWRSQKGNFDITSREEPLLTIADTATAFYADPAAARVSVSKAQTFDADPDFFVLIAHDTSLVDVLDFFPASLDGWKATGHKRDLVWRFVDEANPAFRFGPAT